MALCPTGTKGKATLGIKNKVAHYQIVKRLAFIVGGSRKKVRKGISMPKEKAECYGK